MAVACFVTLLPLAVSTQDARACTYLPQRTVPEPGSLDYPSNGLFSKNGGDWTREDGSLVVFEEDPTLEAIMGDHARFRRAVGLASGERISSVACGTGWACQVKLGERDSISPSPSEIVDRYIYLFEVSWRERLDPPEAEFCGTQAPQVYNGIMYFDLEGTDSGSKQSDMWMLVYFGDTPEDAERATRAGEVRPLFGSTVDGSVKIELYDDSETWALDRPFCYAIELMDRSGNIGARSDASCVDPTDHDSPDVVGPASEGRGCAAAGASGTPAQMLPWMMGWLMVLGWGRRRRIRRGR